MSNRTNLEEILFKLIMNAPRLKHGLAGVDEKGNDGTPIPEDDVRKFCERLLDALERRAEFHRSSQRTLSGEAVGDARAFGYL